MITLATSGCATLVLVLLLGAVLVALPLVPVAVSIESRAGNVQASAESNLNQTVTAIVATNQALETYVAATATAKAWTPTPSACNDCGGGMAYLSPTPTP